MYKININQCTVSISITLIILYALRYNSLYHPKSIYSIFFIYIYILINNEILIYVHLCLEILFYLRKLKVPSNLTLDIDK